MLRTRRVANVYESLLNYDLFIVGSFMKETPHFDEIIFPLYRKSEKAFVMQLMANAAFFGYKWTSKTNSTATRTLLICGF